MGSTDLVNIRLLVQNGRYLIKTHARKRIAERGIRESEVDFYAVSGMWWRILEEEDCA